MPGFFSLKSIDRYSLVGIAVTIFGVIFWAVWRVILPKIFKYELVPNKVILDDGTVVNVVRVIIFAVQDSDSSLTVLCFSFHERNWSRGLYHV